MKFIKNCILLIVIGVTMPKINSQIITEGFETGAAGWHQYLVDGDDPFYLTTDDYNTGGHSVYAHTEKASGLINSIRNESWMISPSMDFSDAARVDLSYFQRNATIYSGSSENPTQQIVYSMNYSGVGDPYNATWYILYDTAASDTWAKTTLINGLPQVDNLTIAFRYVGTSERFTLFTLTSKAWLIDDITIEGFTCATTTVWEGGVWSNGTPSSSSLAILRQDYDTNIHGSFEACSVEIEHGFTLDIAADTYITIHRNFSNDGTLNVAHEGSLLMHDNDAVLDGTGVSNIHKTSNPLKLYDYNYWSSPISDATIGTIFAASPAERIYAYNPLDHDGTNDSGWQPVSSATVMQPGTGYIAMAPLSGSFPQTQSVTFSGQLNNGIILNSVGTNSTNLDSNLIGNPYPSAIDINVFLNDVNNANLDKTIYLWTHNTNWINNPSGTDYSSDDYTSYTQGIGGTAAVSGGTKATGFVASGQSFFINANAAGSIRFTNEMRVHNNNDTFYRNQPTKNQPEEDVDRMWLNMRNDADAFSQLLIGFTDKANNGIDQYDGRSFGSGYVAFYSIIEGENYVINGRSALTEDSEIPLGFVSYLAENSQLNISIDQVTGQLNRQEFDIILEDKKLNRYHDLKQSDYAFTQDAPGTYNDRFSVHLRTTKAGQTQPTNDIDELMVGQFADQLNIETRNQSAMTSVNVYDLQGRLLLTRNKVASHILFNTQALQPGSILIIQAELEDQSRLTKKTILLR